MKRKNKWSMYVAGGRGDVIGCSVPEEIGTLSAERCISVDKTEESLSPGRFVGRLERVSEQLGGSLRITLPLI